MREGEKRDDRIHEKRDEWREGICETLREKRRGRKGRETERRGDGIRSCERE